LGSSARPGAAPLEARASSDALGRALEQFQPRPVGAARGDEPRRGRAEDELAHLAGRIADLEAPALFPHREHDPLLEAAAKVRDPRPRADAGDGSRGSEHETILLLGPPAAAARSGAAPRTATVRSMRRTKIVATIGPTSREPHTLQRMVEAGMDVARLNYSHGTLEEHAEMVRRVRDAGGQGGRQVAVRQDLPGPKLRIGPLQEGVVELTPGQRLTFSCGGEEKPGDATHMSISWAGLADAVHEGTILYLADGSVRLRAVDVRAAAREIEVE